MSSIPESLTNYVEYGNKTDELSVIYSQILNWLDFKDDYYFVIGRLIEICSYILKHLDSETNIPPHLCYIFPDILSILFDKSSKLLKFPENCYCKSENPFYEIEGYSAEYNFWKLFTNLSIKISQKCSPKECYVIFVEIILGSVSLPITSKPDCNYKNENYKDSKLTTLSEKRCELPRFFRYLGLRCSLLCISRMKRNKAQFLTTVCSLTLRKLIYDTDCNSLYVCSCMNSTEESPKYCIVAEIRFLQYLLDNVIYLLFDCLSDSKYDAEYKNQEIGIFNSNNCDNNINVTQHTIYSFLMKILEKLILVDLHDIEMVCDNSYLGITEKYNNLKLISNLSPNKSLDSIINRIFSNGTQLSIHSSITVLSEWTNIIFKLCYYISNVSPQMIIDILNNIPICITDIESQPGDLDITSLSLACYSYSLFVILEGSCDNLTDRIYPKQIISLPSKLNIIFRTVTVFLIYSDSYMYGYEIDHNKKRNDDVLLSYFNTFIQRNILVDNYYIIKFYALIQNRLQEKAYYLLEKNLDNLIICKELIPYSFQTIYGLNWHQNILIKHVFNSFTRYGNEFEFDFGRKNISELYSHLFDKLICTLKKCYDYTSLFTLIYNNIEIHKELASKNPLSGKVIVGLMSKIREIWWEEISTKSCEAALYADFNKMILISLNYLHDCKELENEISQSETLLIILNLIKLLLLSDKRINNNSIEKVVNILIKESNALKNYICKIKNYFDNKTKSKLKDTILFIINDIENILYSSYSYTLFKEKTVQEI